MAIATNPRLWMSSPSLLSITPSFNSSLKEARSSHCGFVATSKILSAPSVKFIEIVPDFKSMISASVSGNLADDCSENAPTFISDTSSSINETCKSDMNDLALAAEVLPLKSSEMLNCGAVSDIALLVKVTKALPIFLVSLVIERDLAAASCAGSFSATDIFCATFAIGLMVIVSPSFGISSMNNFLFSSVRNPPSN